MLRPDEMACIDADRESQLIQPLVEQFWRARGSVVLPEHNVLREADREVPAIERHLQHECPQGPDPHH
jgi:hypothetical protein